MRNARRNKVREYRKAIRGAKGTISLWRLFDKLHPDFFPTNNRWTWHGSDYWHIYRNAQHAWFSKLCQEPAALFHGMGNASASFRRDQNRWQRCQEKQALRDAIANGDDWDDFDVPRPRRNVNWLYW